MEGMRVLLAADEPIEGRALRLLLETTGLHALYVEGLGRARRMLGGRLKDVVLWLGDYLGAEALEQARAIRHAHRDLGLCILANGADPDALRALVADNPRGFAFLLRQRRPEPDELLDALSRAANGHAALEPSLLERLVESASAESSRLELLSRGEREVLELVALGLRNREIARRVSKSEKTVEKRIGQVFSKLGLDLEANRHLDRRVTAARIFLSEQPAAATSSAGAALRCRAA